MRTQQSTRKVFVIALARLEKKTDFKKNYVPKETKTFYLSRIWHFSIVKKCANIP